MVLRMKATWKRGIRSFIGRENFNTMMNHVGWSRRLFSILVDHRDGNSLWWAWAMHLENLSWIKSPWEAHRHVSHQYCRRWKRDSESIRHPTTTQLWSAFV